MNIGIGFRTPTFTDYSNIRNLVPQRFDIFGTTKKYRIVLKDVLNKELKGAFDWLSEVPSFTYDFSYGENFIWQNFEDEFVGFILKASDITGLVNPIQDYDLGQSTTICGNPLKLGISPEIFGNPSGHVVSCRNLHIYSGKMVQFFRKHGNVKSGTVVYKGETSNKWQTIEFDTSQSCLSNLSFRKVVPCHVCQESVRRPSGLWLGEENVTQLGYDNFRYGHQNKAKAVLCPTEFVREIETNFSKGYSFEPIIKKGSAYGDIIASVIQELESKK